MAGRRLPLIAEHSLAKLRQTRAELANNFDRELQQSLLDAKLSISCKSGCSNCCYHPVLITAMEGALMYQWLAERGKWTPSFRAMVKVHADRTKDLSLEVWFLSMLPCPLLNITTQKCIAYDSRPYACRVTYSLGDPNNCHPHRIAQSGIVNKQEVLAAYHREQNQIATRHGLQMILMPISMALLLGAKISTGEIDLEAADRAILEELGGK